MVSSTLYLAATVALVRQRLATLHGIEPSANAVTWHADPLRLPCYTKTAGCMANFNRKPALAGVVAICQCLPSPAPRPALPSRRTLSCHEHTSPIGGLPAHELAQVLAVPSGRRPPIPTTGVHGGGR